MDIQPLFDALDARDAKAAGKLFTEDATFTFGNGEPAVGRGAIEDALSSFFSGLKGVRHRLIRTWEHPDCVEANAALAGLAADLPEVFRLSTSEFVAVVERAFAAVGTEAIGGCGGGVPESPRLVDGAGPGRGPGAPAERVAQLPATGHERVRVL